MKIAVQIFGHLRTYEQCYEGLKKHILDRYNCDVFMHTWETIDHNTETWHNNYMKNADESTSKLKEKLCEIYNLKDIIIEKQESRDLGHYIGGPDDKRSIWGVHCMVHSMSEANRLREEYSAKNNVGYDYVLVLRPDLLLWENFDINKFFIKLTPSELKRAFYTSFYPNGTRWNDLRGFGATDILFFAQPHIISNIYLNKNNFLEKIKPDKGLEEGAAEYYFLKTIEELGYKVWLIDYFESKHFIIRRPNN